MTSNIIPPFNEEKILECFGGVGPSVVLVHGFGANRYSWLGTAPELANHVKAYAVELPGHGNAWDLPVDAGLPQLCEQTLIPALERIVTENDTPVHLVGHSLGGGLAILAAAQKPEQIASLSLLAPLGLGSGADSNFIENFVDLDDEASMVELLQRTLFNKRLISRELVEPLLIHLRKEGVRATLKVIANDVLNPGEELQRAVDKVSRSALPRQVIWGLNDSISTLVTDDENHFGGHWHKLENCGHLPHVEKRVQVNRLLLDMVLHTADV